LSLAPSCFTSPRRFNPRPLLHHVFCLLGDSPLSPERSRHRCPQLILLAARFCWPARYFGDIRIPPRTGRRCRCAIVAVVAIQASPIMPALFRPPRAIRAEIGLAGLGGLIVRPIRCSGGDGCDVLGEQHQWRQGQGGCYSAFSARPYRMASHVGRSDDCTALHAWVRSSIVVGPSVTVLAPKAGLWDRQWRKNLAAGIVACCVAIPSPMSAK